jgi:hypothetical protein
LARGGQTAPGAIVKGERGTQFVLPLKSSPIHRVVERFPRRIVVARVSHGWNVCNLCLREHRVWMTEDSTWRRLPRRFRKELMCTHCFRKIVGDK